MKKASEITSSCYHTVDNTVRKGYNKYFCENCGLDVSTEVLSKKLEEDYARDARDGGPKVRRRHSLAVRFLLNNE